METNVIIANVVLSIIGLIMIWIGLFGGTISYRSKGAFPQVIDFIKKRREQKKVLEAMQESEYERRYDFKPVKPPH